MSEPIQSIAQNNYILQAPPPTATMFTTELEYDGDKISGYAGSAFKAGTDLDFGYTEADTISSINTSSISDVSLNNIVQTNSASWGGNALPISAGPGVKINFVNNTLVFSKDETVLWTGTGSTTGSTINLNESLTHFEKYGLYYYIPYQESNQPYYQEFIYKQGQSVFGIKTDGINSTLWRMYCDYGTMTDTSISLVSGRQGGVWLTATPQEITWYDGSERHHYITKVVGINRK